MNSPSYLLLLSALCVLCALAFDRWWGEPPARWHPVVWMGRWLGMFSPWLRSLPAGAPAFAAGALAWCAGAALVLTLAWLAQDVLHQLWRLDDPLRAVGVVLGLGLGGLLLKPLLAWRMLRNEVRAVDQALDHSLEEARAQLSRLVSRDTRHLDATAVREAAIETLAENLNDSVVAPLFWFAVAGLPGAALYRFANTADAMWGYRGEWEWAGKWAARADDLLSWLPARLTAWLLGLAAGQRHAWRGLPGLGAQACRTPSPNGGWPMGAMALLLGCRLGKPGVYLLNEGGRPVGGAEHLLALLWAGRVVALLALLAAAVAVLAFAVTMSAELGWAAALTSWGSSPRATGVWSVPVVP